MRPVPFQIWSVQGTGTRGPPDRRRGTTSGPTAIRRRWRPGGSRPRGVGGLGGAEEANEDFGRPDGRPVRADGRRDGVHAASPPAAVRSELLRLLCRDDVPPTLPARRPLSYILGRKYYRHKWRRRAQVLQQWPRLLCPEKMMFPTCVIAQGAFTSTDLGRDHERKRQSAPPQPSNANSEEPKTKKRKKKSQADHQRPPLARPLRWVRSRRSPNEPYRGRKQLIEEQEEGCEVLSSPVAAPSPLRPRNPGEGSNEVAREFMFIKVGIDVGQEEDGQFVGQLPGCRKGPATDGRPRDVPSRRKEWTDTNARRRRASSGGRVGARAGSMGRQCTRPDLPTSE
ncbi:hypothetical protein THAOC_00394 [Thalassiosira oceanica]|uniref:Uncharacterized protein n=1 Tax=Thalassiosira oceanica TaxID=159749 RepID=K3W4D6_THAOC|nr:hypothetical protein THAOC_00394 [Thalassiosira oceanica]|eukprot:EJK77754.1 hypothetical protein THAOC_00394 [Thalassiosira oceanica]